MQKVVALISANTHTGDYHTLNSNTFQAPALHGLDDKMILKLIMQFNTAIYWIMAELL